jgi:hypothetical protein
MHQEIKHTSSHLSLFLISILFLLSGCEDSDKIDSPPEPPQEGLAVYMQAIMHANEKHATIGTTLYDNGNKITFVGGDSVRVANRSSEVVLKGDKDNFGFYQGILDLESPSLGLNFSVDYLPIESRSDRWYPSDIAYVDAGAGEYVGLNWHIDFPQTIQIIQPVANQIYNYAEDLVTVSWQNTSSNVDNTHVNAHLHCVNEIVELYEGEDSGEITVSIAEMFAPLKKTKSENILKTFFNLVLKTSTFGLVHLDSDESEKISQCDITLIVLSDFREDIGPPFVEGSLTASRGASLNIQFNPFEPLNL